MAYGIVKALLLKKEMGLPMPGAGVQHHDAVADGATHAPSSSQNIANMFTWKPQDSASDGADAELAAVEQSEQVTKAPAPEAVAAPQPVEEALPEVAPVETAVEAPKTEAAPAE